MAAMTHDKGATVIVQCNGERASGLRRRSQHEAMVVDIATFQEQLNENGRRVAIDVVMHVRTTTATGVDIVTTPRPDQEIGPRSGGRVVRSTRPSTVVESVIDPVNGPVANPSTSVDDDSNWYWHDQLECPLAECRYKLSMPAEKLRGAIGLLMDHGVARVTLDALARMLP